VCALKLLLAIPTKFVGNMTIALAAIRAALDSGHDVTLLIDDNFTDLVRLAIGDDPRVLSYPRRQLAQGSTWARAKHYLRFIWQLRRDKYDTALDLDGTVVSARLVGMVRARVKTGPAFTSRARIYQQLVPVNHLTQHCFDDYADMLRPLGISVPSEHYLNLPASPEVPTVTKKLGLETSRPIAVIHPSASAGKEYKQWALAYFAELATWLDGAGWQVVIVGAGSAEQVRVEQLLEQTAATVVNACNQLSITELAALCQAATVFVGNDSGPMHVATAAGCQIIALFGPSDSVRWNPKGPHVTVVRGVLPCGARCASERCDLSYQCMTSLTLKQVQAAVADLQLPFR